MSCDGRCCSVFNYSATPEQLRQRSEGREGFWPDQDRFLADMLIELTPDEALARAERFEVEPPAGLDLREWCEGYKAYTCRHWDEETRLCTVYEDRPQMCRDYPYNRECQHGCGCRAPTEVRTKWAAIEVREAVRDAEAAA